MDKRTKQLMRPGRSRKWISGFLILMMLVSHLNIMAAGAEQIVVINKAQTVVTIGADLSEEQKAFMMQYFGLSDDQVRILTVTNEDEHKQLDALLTEDRIGKQTFSCAAVRPAFAGGIQVKTVNMTYVTSNMIASSLVTSGIYNCEVITAAPFKVTGTGALTGIMMAYESASGMTIAPEKKELANEELIITQEVSDDVGKNRATLIVNDIKILIARDQVTDTNAVYAVVDNVIAAAQQAAYAKAMKKGKDAPKEITAGSTQRLYDFGKKFSQGNYKYREMQRTLERVTYNVVKKTGYDDPIVDTFTTLDDETPLDQDSIFLAAADDLLDEDALVNATSSAALGGHEAEKIDVFKGDVTLTGGSSVSADAFIDGTSIVPCPDSDWSYALVDLTGNVLTDYLYEYKFGVVNGHIVGALNDSSQTYGILETDGSIGVPFKYPMVEIFGTHWAAGMNLSETGTEENYDYWLAKYNGADVVDVFCLIDTIDMYYIDDGGGKLVGTLTREQMKDPHSVNAHGPYINIMAKNDVITVYDPDFNVIGTTDDLYAGSEDETNKIRDAITEKTGCSVESICGNYAVVKDYTKDRHNTGVVDFYGNYIIPTEFDAIDTSCFSNNGSLAAHGYFSGELDGKFVYIRQGGKVKATCEYPAESIENNGMSAIYKPSDKGYTILSADGKTTELDSKYEDVYALSASKGMLYECVDWDSSSHDLVDWHGNVLLSGAMRFSLASNGNYLISQEDYSSFTLYQVNGASPAALANSKEGAA